MAQALDAAGGDGDGVEATICARDFEIHVDLVVERGAEGRAEALERSLVEPISRYLFAREETPIEELVLAECRARGLTLATAESCTGGLVSARLTSVPGSSDVFRGGIVAYADEVKARSSASGGGARGSTAPSRPRWRPRWRRCPRPSRCGRRGGGDRHRRARRRRRRRSPWGSSTSTRLGPPGSGRCGSTSRATARPFAAVRRWRRCTSCGDSSRNRDGHGTPRRVAWPVVNGYASSAPCGSPTTSSSRSSDGSSSTLPAAGSCRARTSTSRSRSSARVPSTSSGRRRRAPCRRRGRQ